MRPTAKLQREMIYDLAEDLHHTMDAYIASTTIRNAKPNLQPLPVDPYGLL